MIDHFEDQLFVYIVMEKPAKYVVLLRYIDLNGPLEEWVARLIFSQVLEAVQYCHSMGVFHRDIKTNNILVHVQSYNIKLIDFGSATSFSDEQIYTENVGKTERKVNIAVYIIREWN